MLIRHWSSHVRYEMARLSTVHSGRDSDYLLLERRITFAVICESNAGILCNRNFIQPQMTDVDWQMPFRSTSEKSEK